MAMMGSGSPVFQPTTYDQFQLADQPAQNVMTVNGTINKSLVLLALVMATAYMTWNLAWNQIQAAGEAGQVDLSGVIIWVVGGAIGGFILGLITVFKPTFAPVTAPLYALAQGLFLGAISAVFEANYPGIVINAVGATFGTLLGMLVIYRSGLIKVNQKFIMGVAAATFAVFVFYGGAILLSLLGFSGGIDIIWGSGWLGIGISVVVIIIAAMNLLIDFHTIETGAARRAPRYMEWYAGFGLLVTLIWLYIEFLRLFAKLQRR